MDYYSQAGQDEILNTHVFKGYLRGIFVDVGAWDGVDFSNTLFFEKHLKWSGILIEPLQERYDQLVKNRPNTTNLNVAVSDFDGETEFLAITGYAAMLSGINSNYDARHLQRIKNETPELETSTKIVKVPVRRLDSIFREHNVQRVHYLSIDVEGSEMKIIQSIDFDYTYIDVIGFENNYPDVTELIIQFLYKKGYSLLKYESCDVFMIHNNSPFL